MSLELQAINDGTKALWKRVPKSGAVKLNKRSLTDLRLTRGILSNFSEDEQGTRGGW